MKSLPHAQPVRSQCMGKLTLWPRSEGAPQFCMRAKHAARAVVCRVTARLTPRNVQARTADESETCHSSISGMRFKPSMALSAMIAFT